MAVFRRGQKCVIFPRNCKFANLIQYNTQDIRCYSVILAQVTLFWNPKKSLFFCPKSFKMCVNREKSLITQQNSVCLGLKFLSHSKLFGECPSRLCATSATLFNSKILILCEKIKHDDDKNLVVCGVHCDHVLEGECGRC